MNRKKKGRSFRVRASRPASPMAFILALLLLIALGVTAWFLDSREGTPSPFAPAAPAPVEGGPGVAVDSAGDPLPTPSAIPIGDEPEVTAAPDGQGAAGETGVSAPANPMTGWSPFTAVAFAENTEAKTETITDGDADESMNEDSVEGAPEDASEGDAAPYVPVHAVYMTTEPFTPGALSGLKIGIDPGHQAHADNGQEPVSPTSSQTKARVSSGTAGVSTGRDEFEVNLEVGLALRDALLAEGAAVLMTRETNDVSISNVERAQMMNEWGADVVLRLHCNGTDNSAANGIGLYVKSSGEGAAGSRAICDPLLEAMGRATGARTESVHVSDVYSGLNWSTVPSILVEMGYMSNPDEDRRLCSPDYQALLVKGMVDGLIAYFAPAE